MSNSIQTTQISRNLSPTFAFLTLQLLFFQLKFRLFLFWREKFTAQKPKNAKIGFFFELLANARGQN